ncbi:MAG: aminotransferase class I/II-fold pyridoxal phosphate-dependent enzyme [Gemmatimonadaceae bacterium]
MSENAPFRPRHRTAPQAMVKTPETRTFYVVSLEDNSHDRAQIRDVSCNITGAVEEFFTEHFSPAKGQVSVKTIIAPDAARLVQLLTNDGDAEPLSEHVILLLLDYYVLPGDPRMGVTADPRDLLPDGTARLHSITVGGISLPTWLHTRFPATPAVLLTHADPDVENPAGLASIPWPKAILRSPGDLAVKIRQLLDRHFAPRFWPALRRYAENEAGDSWHTPGHNRGNGFSQSVVQGAFYRAYGPRVFDTDLSVSVDHLGDLSEPDAPGPLVEAQQRAARVFGARETFFITNGTSTSNKALLSALLRPGEVVIIDRNCHKSVHQSVIMSGARPLYLPTRFNGRLGVWAPVRLDTIQKALEADFGDQQPRVMVLTSCTYEGVHYPVRDIAFACERAGVLLVADEAWAPHARFHPSYIAESGGRQAGQRYSALDAGAHFAVQSSHKTLAAFSQASMLHVSDRFAELFKQTGPDFDWLRQRFANGVNGGYSRFRHELMESLRYWHSTSPHYPMLATLELAGIQMAIEGPALLGERRRWVKQYLDESGVFGRAMATLDDIVGGEAGAHYRGYFKDPLKVVIRVNTAGEQHPGTQCDALCTKLKEAHVQWEKSSVGTVEFLVTIGTTLSNIKTLAYVLTQHRDLLDLSDYSNHAVAARDDLKYDPEWTRLAVTPRDAVLHDRCELVELDVAASTDETVGRIAAQFLVPYPPGIPLVIPGLMITDPLRAWVCETVLLGERRQRGAGARNVHGLMESGGHYFIRVLPKNYEVPSQAAIDQLQRVANTLS